MILTVYTYHIVNYTNKSLRDKQLRAITMTILSENTDELIALAVVIPTIAVMGYQAVMAQEITMPTEPAMLILGYYFGKKVTG